MGSFNRSSWLILGFVLLILVINLINVIYRFMQPSDGWILSTEPDNSPFKANALGETSPLLPYDNLIAVNGHTIREVADPFRFQDLRSADWQAGKTVTYRIQRDGKELDLEVLLYHWTAGAVLKTMATPFTFFSILLFGFCCFVFVRQPLDWGARAFLLFSTSSFTAVISGNNQVVDVLLPTWPLTAFFTYLIWGWLMFPSFLMLALSFPRPKRFIQKHPGWTILGVYGATPALVLVTGDPGIGWMTVIGFSIMSLIAVVHSALTTKDAISRAQLRWAGTGIAIGAVAFILNNVAATYFAYIAPTFSSDDGGVFADLPIIIGFGSMALGFAIAILRYRLFDIDVIIRRTLQYSLLTALLALVYFGAVTVLQNLFQAVIGESSTAAIVVSTLTIAALFNPLRRRLQEFIDRRFYRQKYDAEQALAEFAAKARRETDLMQLSQELLQVIEQTLQPTQINLYLMKKEKKI